mmetsp:Transcript_5356/g.12297  ORF Transcript_5356/g.12297 Transcript_5356/m.12297 type:complete len:374 (+) Transcript_5356:433-1554(+)
MAGLSRVGAVHEGLPRIFFLREFLLAHEPRPCQGAQGPGPSCSSHALKVGNLHRCSIIRQRNQHLALRQGFPASHLFQFFMEYFQHLLLLRNQRHDFFRADSQHLCQPLTLSAHHCTLISLMTQQGLRFRRRHRRRRAGAWRHGGGAICHLRPLRHGDLLLWNLFCNLLLILRLFRLTCSGRVKGQLFSTLGLQANDLLKVLSEVCEGGTCLLIHLQAGNQSIVGFCRVALLRRKLCNRIKEGLWTAWSGLGQLLQLGSHLCSFGPIDPWNVAAGEHFPNQSSSGPHISFMAQLLKGTVLWGAPPSSHWLFPDLMVSTLLEDTGKPKVGDFHLDAVWVLSKLAHQDVSAREICMHHSCNLKALHSQGDLRRSS